MKHALLSPDLIVFPAPDKNPTDGFISGNVAGAKGAGAGLATGWTRNLAACLKDIGLALGELFGYRVTMHLKIVGHGAWVDAAMEDKRQTAISGVLATPPAVLVAPAALVAKGGHPFLLH